jgi:Na+-translocating ferredoxin:NAD+ oxidoreductase RnfA subunit
LQGEVEEKKSLWELVGIFTIVWILVLLGTGIIFDVIVPLNLFHSFLDSIVKGLLAAVLVGVWLLLFIGLRNRMVKSQLRLEKKMTTA